MAGPDNMRSINTSELGLDNKEENLNKEELASVKTALDDPQTLLILDASQRNEMKGDLEAMASDDANVINMIQKLDYSLPSLAKGASAITGSEDIFASTPDDINLTYENGSLKISKGDTDEYLGIGEQGSGTINLGEGESMQHTLTMDGTEYSMYLAPSIDKGKFDLVITHDKQVFGETTGDITKVGDGILDEESILPEALVTGKRIENINGVKYTIDGENASGLSIDDFYIAEIIDPETQESIIKTKSENGVISSDGKTLTIGEKTYDVSHTVDKETKTIQLNATPIESDTKAPMEKELILDKPNTKGNEVITEEVIDKATVQENSIQAPLLNISAPKELLLTTLPSGEEINNSDKILDNDEFHAKDKPYIEYNIADTNEIILLVHDTSKQWSGTMSQIDESGNRKVIINTAYIKDQEHLENVYINETAHILIKKEDPELSVGMQEKLAECALMKNPRTIRDGLERAMTRTGENISPGYTELNAAYLKARKKTLPDIYNQKLVDVEKIPDQDILRIGEQFIKNVYSEHQVYLDGKKGITPDMTFNESKNGGVGGIDIQSERAIANRSENHLDSVLGILHGSREMNTDILGIYKESFFGKEATHVRVELGEQLIAVDKADLANNNLGIDTNSEEIQSSKKPETLKYLISTGKVGATSMSTIMGKFDQHGFTGRLDEKKVTILDNTTLQTGTDKEQYQLLQHVVGIKTHNEETSKVEKKSQAKESGIGTSIFHERIISGIGSGIERLTNNNDYLSEKQAEKILETNNRKANRKNDRAQRKASRNATERDLGTLQGEYHIYENMEDAVGATATIQNGAMIYIPKKDKQNSIFVKFDYKDKQGEEKSMYIKKEKWNDAKYNFTAGFSRRGEKRINKKEKKEKKEFTIDKRLFTLEKANIHLSELENTVLLPKAKKDDGNTLSFETSFTDGKRKGKTKVERSTSLNGKKTVMNIGKESFPVDTSKQELGTTIRNTSQYLNLFQSAYSDFKSKGTFFSKKENRGKINPSQKLTIDLKNNYKQLITGERNNKETVTIGNKELSTVGLDASKLNIDKTTGEIVEEVTPLTGADYKNFNDIA